MNRRELIRGIGKAICAGYAAPFIPSLLPGGIVGVPFEDPKYWYLEECQFSVNDLHAAILENIKVYGEVHITCTPPRDVRGDSVIATLSKSFPEVKKIYES